MKKCEKKAVVCSSFAMGRAHAGKRRFALSVARRVALGVALGGFSGSHIGRPLSEKVSLGMDKHHPTDKRIQNV